MCHTVCLVSHKNHLSFRYVVAFSEHEKLRRTQPAKADNQIFHKMHEKIL